MINDEQSNPKRSKRGKLRHKPPSQWMTEAYDSPIEPEGSENGEDFAVTLQDDIGVAEKRRLRAASYHSRIR